MHVLPIAETKMVKKSLKYKCRKFIYQIGWRKSEKSERAGEEGGREKGITREWEENNEREGDVVGEEEKER